ncbi:MAG: hypothetical protein ABJA74_01195 [Lapillicoccus sp.]
MRLGTLGVTVPSVQDRVLYDHAISPTSVGDIAAIAEGAQRVILVGASKGAKASLVAAAGLPAEQVTAVVALSPEAALADGTPVLDKSRARRSRRSSSPCPATVTAPRCCLVPPPTRSTRPSPHT